MERAQGECFGGCAWGIGGAFGDGQSLGLYGGQKRPTCRTVLSIFCAVLSSSTGLTAHHKIPMEGLGKLLDSQRVFWGV
jgi:hypothetical protein